MPRILIVDQNDQVIGSATDVSEAVSNGQIRRIVRVFLFNEKGEMLIQRRSAYIKKPLHWDHSVGGHVDEGEDYQEAAYREVQEELGIHVPELKVVKQSVFAQDAFIGVFTGLIASDTQIVLDPHEVDTYRWISLEDLSDFINDNNQECTDGLTDVWPLFRDEIVGMAFSGKPELLVEAAKHKNENNL